MDTTVILHAGVASGTVLLFATIGEIFAERSGILNLGVEGMMIVGAVCGFAVAAESGNLWFGVAAAVAAGAGMAPMKSATPVRPKQSKNAFAAYASAGPQD